MGWLTGNSDKGGTLGDVNGQSALIEDNGGKTDIYLNGGSGHLGPDHGHIVVNDGGGVEYWRDTSGGVSQDSQKGIMD
ncbi:hypothetical protein CR969_03510 [Candidatus Saccharibacteria bacterium]|nr:MAG: hypothetical protein CR969_03510 [Candidatus Saccharibacteria bacterium]